MLHPTRWIRSMSLMAASILTATLMAPPAAVRAQSASDILDEALQHYEQRMEGIDNYTVVQSVEGLPGAAGSTTLYFEKTMVDGHPVFMARNPAMDSVMRMQEEAGVTRSPSSTLRALKDRASVEGSDTVDGHDCWVLHVDDAAALADLEGAGAGGNFELTSMRMCIDKEDYVVRSMSMEGDMSVNGETRPVTMDSQLSDYREVDGLLHPFRTDVRMSGMMEGSMDPEERAKLQQQMAQLKEQMAQMPEAQRAMMEKIMGGQMDRLQQMLDEDALTMTLTVTDLKVNAGPPGGQGGGAGGSRL